jgi:putative transposase
LSKSVKKAFDSNSSNEGERKSFNMPAKSKRGRKRSSFTKKLIINENNKETITILSDDMVKNDIKDLLSREFVCYGYKKVAKFLKKNSGYIINPKKVYRLMKEMSLLLPKIRPLSSCIERVKSRFIYLTRPNELWQIDIKYLYIHGEKRNSYVCTIIDCFTKEAIVFFTGYIV